MDRLNPRELAIAAHWAVRNNAIKNGIDPERVAAWSTEESATWLSRELKKLYGHEILELATVKNFLSCGGGLNQENKVKIVPCLGYSSLEEMVAAHKVAVKNQRIDPQELKRAVRLFAESDPSITPQLLVDKGIPLGAAEAILEGNTLSPSHLPRVLNIFGCGSPRELIDRATLIDEKKTLETAAHGETVQNPPVKQF